jgi:hypothetical protein
MFPLHTKEKLMYGKITAALGVPAGALAYTGLNTAWYIVAGATLLFAGVALLKLVPKRSR